MQVDLLYFCIIWVAGLHITFKKLKSEHISQNMQVQTRCAAMTVGGSTLQAFH